MYIHETFIGVNAQSAIKKGPCNFVGWMTVEESWRVAQERQLEKWRRILAVEQDPRGKAGSEYEAILGDLMNELPSAASVLDVGCGPQPLVENLRGPRRVACDPLLLDFVKLRKIPFALLVNCIGERLPFKDKTFDWTVCVNAIDHFRDPFSSLLEISRVTKTGAFFELHLTPPSYRILRRIGLKQWAPVYHHSTISGRNFIRMLKSAGFEVERSTSFVQRVSLRRVRQALPSFLNAVSSLMKEPDRSEILEDTRGIGSLIHGWILPLAHTVASKINEDLWALKCQVIARPQPQLPTDPGPGNRQATTPTAPH